MREGKRADADRAIFVNGQWRLGVNLVEDDFIGGIGTEVVYLWLEDACEVFGPIDVKVLDASEQSESGQHAEESKGVVTMQVSEEDGLKM